MEDLIFSIQVITDIGTIALKIFLIIQILRLIQRGIIFLDLLIAKNKSEE